MINIKNIVITPEILKLITEIDEFKGAWQQMSRISPDRLSALKKIATIESIGSSTRIEGASLTDREIEKFLSQADSKTFETRDEQEVAGYSFLCEQIFNYFNEMPLSENTIKQLHCWLLQYSEKDDYHRGDYKKIPIHIEAFDSEGKSLGRVFETISPMETPLKIFDLLNWTNKAFEENQLHPLIVISLFVVLFLAIHPFQDGNGRLSRLLTTFLMLKTGYHYVPYSSLESVIEHNKESYYLALQKTQKSWQKNKPDWSFWLLFFLRCLQRQKHHLEIKILKERILLSTLPDLQRNILELLKTHGLLNIKDLLLLTKSNRNTLKKALSSLVRTNHIEKIGNGKATKYMGS